MKIAQRHGLAHQSVMRSLFNGQACIYSILMSSLT